MTIPGFELRRQVEAHLAALEREKASVMHPRHLEEINSQIRVFTAALDRMQATGEGDEPATTDRALGTLAHVGSYEDRVPGARAVPRR